MFASIRRPARLSPLALCLLLAACSSEKTPVDANGDGIDDGIVTPNNVTVVTPSEPVGYVAGLVVSAVTGAPVANASVTIFGGGITGTTTTDDTGALSFGPIAAGAGFSLHVVADGFLDVTLAGLSVDDAAGNFPTSNGATFVGPIGLVPSSGSFAVQLVSRAGAAVPNATVTFEARPRWVHDGEATGSFVVTATSDIDGLVRVTGLPDARLLPAGLSTSLDVTIAPVDLGGDGAIDLVGTSVTYDDEALRRGGRAPVIVLGPEERQSLQVVAANVSGLISGGAASTSVVATSEDVRLVFNEPIDRDSVIIDLRDEAGAASIPAPYVVGSLGNTLSFGPATDLEAGRQYGVSVHVQSTASGAPQVYDGAAYFFTRVDPAAQLGLAVRLRDRNSDQQWGTGDDVVELTMAAPIGKPGATTPFQVSLWLALDLDGSGTVGDGTGELPPNGAQLPRASVTSAANVSWLSGVAATGYARSAVPIALTLAVPHTQAQGGVAYEAWVTDQDGRRVADVSGRPVAARLTGTATLQ